MRRGRTWARKMYRVRSLASTGDPDRLHMPAWIDPLAFAEDKDLGDPTGERGAFAVFFQFVEIRRIDDCDAAVTLNFSIGEFQTHKLPAALRELRRTLQDAASVAQLTRP